MKITHLIIVALSLGSCSSSSNKKEEVEVDKFKDSLISVINQKSAGIDEKSFPIDSVLYIDLFSDYRRLAVTYPNDSVSEKFLYKCALMNFYQKRYDDFMFTMERYDNEYSRYEDYATLSFLKAYVIFLRSGDTLEYERSKRVLLRENNELSEFIQKIEKVH